MLADRELFLVSNHWGLCVDTCCCLLLGLGTDSLKRRLVKSTNVTHCKISTEIFKWDFSMHAKLFTNFSQLNQKCF